MYNISIFLSIITIIILYYINYNLKSKIVFYTCFFGDNNNSANKINNAPSLYYDCYYFTNNKENIKLLKHTNWIPIFINIPIKKTLNENAMDSKELKACPHHFAILNNYEYSCYFDSKLNVNSYKIEKLINAVYQNNNYLYIVSIHPFVKSNIWQEYIESQYQERYRLEKDNYVKYIVKQLNSGLKEDSDFHYQTGLIIRKSSSKTNEINELWYKHIKECGIECQISFFFIQQIYKKYIYPIDAYIN